MTGSTRKARSAAEIALEHVARRFDIHLRLAREMLRDRYLRLAPKEPEYEKWDKSPPHFWRRLGSIQTYYNISFPKLINIYSAGYIHVYGLDLQEAVKRYMQRNCGQLSVRLLCHLAYDEIRPLNVRIENPAAEACLSALKVDGKIAPPKHLASDLDGACRGNQAKLDRIAEWMRDQIDSSDQPRGWAFFGLRLALLEGHYGPQEYPIPSLRKWSKREKVRGLLREHDLIKDCVRCVPKQGKSNGEFSYRFQRPEFDWDL